MGKGGADVYQSEHTPQADELGFETVLGMLTGQGIAPSPTMNSSIVAQQLGGEYNADSDTIKMPDGSIIKFNALTNSFESVGGGTEGKWQDYSYDRVDPATGKTVRTNVSEPSQLDELRSSGQQLYYQGKPATAAAGSEYLNAANQTLAGLNESVYNNPSSAYNLFDTYGQKTYDPTTGQYRDLAPGETPPQALTSDYYMSKYGSVFDKPYEQFDYQAPTVGSVDNVSDAARMNIYQRGADRISQVYNEADQSNEAWAAEQGGGVNSGRLQKLRQKNLMDKSRDVGQLSKDVDTEHEMRNYEDAKHRRDLETSLAWDATKARGDESRYGQDRAYDQGTKKIATVEAIDSANRDRGFQDLQANRQQKLQQMSALLDMLRVYGGMDSTAAQLAAAQAQSAGSALSGLFGMTGKIAGAA